MSMTFDLMDFKFCVVRYCGSVVDRYACDNTAVCLLWERGLDNSVSQLHKKLCEQHSEDWLQWTVQYLTVR